MNIWSVTCHTSQSAHTEYQGVGIQKDRKAWNSEQKNILVVTHGDSVEEVRDILTKNCCYGAKNWHLEIDKAEWIGVASYDRSRVNNFA